ncbi:MAG: helix-turn-helix domain-containing protein [Acidimicrobiales bacterium]
MSPRGPTVSYRWHLRMVMAERGMFATSDLRPLLGARGVTLSREQVYRLVAKVPERLSLTTLAALCDILECTPTDLIEPVRSAPTAPTPTARPQGAPAQIRPRRARVARPQG